MSPRTSAPGLRLLWQVACAPQVRTPLLAATSAGVPLDGPNPRLATLGRGGFRPTAEGDRVAALVTLSQQGDVQAFAALYDCYVTTVYRYVYYRTGSRQTAEDLTSETFLKALRRIDSFSWQGRDIGAWLLTIARNLTVDFHRSNTFRLEVSTDDLLLADRGDDGLEAGVMARLESAELVAALRRLKPEQQECLVLRFLQGLSVTETARVLGRSEGAVKQLQLRALRSLARLLPRDDTSRQETSRTDRGTRNDPPPDRNSSDGPPLYDVQSGAKAPGDARAAGEG